MPYLLLLKKQQNLKLSSAANCRWHFMGYQFAYLEQRWSSGVVDIKSSQKLSSSGFNKCSLNKCFSHLPNITLLLSLYSWLKPKVCIFLHQAWPRWSLQYCSVLHRGLWAHLGEIIIRSFACMGRRSFHTPPQWYNFRSNVIRPRGGQKSRSPSS